MNSEVILEIPQGKLRGKKDKSIYGTDLYCFHQIPYAKPPVDNLRFMPPEPAEGWTGIRDATTDGLICPSFDMIRGVYIKESSEDCLFINVYCKENPNDVKKKKYPVIIWIHGGGFAVGSGNRSMCGPDYLLLHDVILVTCNYRLGPLGFLSLQTIECPGNYGLKDQHLAIQWVKNNISHFGGDPNNVTLMGISAGGASVQYHSLHLKSKGLFQRIIAQSGSSLNRWGYSRRPRDIAFLLGKRLGCDAKNDKALLDFLRKAPVEDIVTQSQGLIFEVEGTALGEHFLNFSFVPTAEPEHEGAFFSKHPWELLKEGKYLDVPCITGLCAKEMILGVKNVNDYPSFTKDEEFQAFIPRDIQWPKNSEEAMSLAETIKKFYFSGGIDLHNYIDLLSDTFFNYGVYKTVKSRTTNPKHVSPTYLYLFSYEGDQSWLKQWINLQDIKGTSHGEDSIYLFKLDMVNTDNMVPGKKDYNVMYNLTKLWTSFATNGVPTLNEPDFSWKETNAKELNYLNIGQKFVPEKGLLKKRMEFWDEKYSSFYNRK